VNNKPIVYHVVGGAHRDALRWIDDNSEWLNAYGVTTKTYSYQDVVYGRFRDRTLGEHDMIIRVTPHLAWHEHVTAAEKEFKVAEWRRSYFAPSSPSTKDRVRVVRVLEYTYASLAEANEDQARWTTTTPRMKQVGITVSPA
jgi:hypothetical protein